MSFRRCNAAALAIVTIAGSVFAVVSTVPASASPSLIRVGFATSDDLGASVGPVTDRRISVDFVLRSDAHGRAERGAAATVAQWLKHAGIAFVASSDAVSIDAPLTQVAALLHANFADYRFDRRATFAASAPRVPATVATAIGEILGLSDTPVAISNVVMANQEHSTRGLSPAIGSDPGSCAGDGSSTTMAATGDHYGVASLLASGDEGKGVSVAVIELGASSSSDIATYDSCMGLTSSYSVTPIDGGAATGTPDGTIEADLDIEQIETQAPEATVVSYEAPNTSSGFYDAINAAVTADTSSVISISWTGCELQDGGIAYSQSLDALFATAAAQGQTVIVATGDEGAEGCYTSSDPTDPNAPPYADDVAVQYPSDSAYVTAVGGTNIVRPYGSPSYDVVWNDCEGSPATCAQNPNYGAGGGGVSVAIGEPSWQSSAVGPLGGRAEPDVSLNAAPTEEAYADGSWSTFGGTSLSAPMLAGFVADVVPTCSTAIGNLAPRLYAQYDAARYSSQSSLIDVVDGNNNFLDEASGDYVAGYGYDLASGLGTVRASALMCPSIAALSQSSGVVGSTIDISGSDLSTANGVDFGTTSASFTPISPTMLAVTVPSGVGEVPVDVSNFMGASTTLEFTYAPAAITSVAAASGAVGSPFSFQITSTGVPTPTLAVSALPAGLNITLNDDGTALITGVPTVVGTTVVTVTATNVVGGSSESATQLISLTVNPPVGVPDPLTTDTTTTTTTTTQPPTSTEPPSTTPPVTIVAPITTTTVPRARVVIAALRAAAGRHFVPVRLRCELARCKGTSELTDSLVVVFHRAGHRELRRITVVIARAGFNAVANERFSSSLRLTVIGARILASARRKPVSLTLVVRDSTAVFTAKVLVT